MTLANFQLKKFFLNWFRHFLWCLAKKQTNSEKNSIYCYSSVFTAQKQIVLGEGGGILALCQEPCSPNVPLAMAVIAATYGGSINFHRHRDELLSQLKLN